MMTSSSNNNTNIHNNDNSIDNKNNSKKKHNSKDNNRNTYTTSLENCYYNVRAIQQKHMIFQNDIAKRLHILSSQVHDCFILHPNNWDFCDILSSQ